MAFVQSGVNGASGSLSELASTGLTTTSGNALVVGFLSHYGNSDVRISDNYGNTWTPHPANPEGVASGNCQVYAWVAEDIVGGSGHVVTIEFTFASTDMCVVVQEYSGRATSNIVDATGYGQDASSTGSHSNGSVTTVTAGDDVVAICLGSLTTYSEAVLTVGSGWTAGSTSNSYCFTVAEYQADVSVGTYTATWSNNSGYNCYGAGLLFALAPASSSNVTVDLTGQALDSTLGALTASLNYAFDGEALTSTEGAISANTGGNVTVALSGQAITSGQGALDAALGYAISGTEISSTEGALGGAISYALIGQASVSAEGALSASWSAQVALAGQAVQSTLGSPLAALAPSLAGQSIASAYGSMSLSLTVELDGETIASAYGTITASGGTIPAIVPDVLGYTFGNAYLALIAKGFVVGAPSQSRPVPRMPPGVVLAQSPAAQSEAAEGSTVTLTVNGTPPVWPTLQ